MDLSTGSIGWHRTRQWLDEEVDRISHQEKYLRANIETEGNEYSFGLLDGMKMAYLRIRPRFNTSEESEQAEKTRREMFG